MKQGGEAAYDVDNDPFMVSYKTYAKKEEPLGERMLGWFACGKKPPVLPQTDEFDFLMSSHRHTLFTTLCIGAYMPTFIFVVLVGLFSFTSYHCPQLPWCAVVVSCTVVAGTWPSVPLGTSRRSKFDLFPVYCGFVTIVAGSLLGLWNCSHLQPWIFDRYLNHYSDIIPTSDTRAFAGAGVLHFMPGSSLETKSSAGYLAWPHIYCAAPIVNLHNGQSNLSGMHAGFWAVGLDCCDSRGHFICDDARNATVNGGLRVESSPYSFDAQENYMHAVRMAAGLYGIRIDHEPVLIAWVSSPSKTAERAWWTTFSIFITFLVAAMCFCSCCHVMLTRLNARQYSF